MGDSQVRTIVEGLNAAPFNKTYSLISYGMCGSLSCQSEIEFRCRFDALEPLALLQVLNDVFAEISPEVRVCAY